MYTFSFFCLFGDCRLGMGLGMGVGRMHSGGAGGDLCVCIFGRSLGAVLLHYTQARVWVGWEFLGIDCMGFSVG